MKKTILDPVFSLLSVFKHPAYSALLLLLIFASFKREIIPGSPADATVKKTMNEDPKKTLLAFFSFNNNNDLSDSLVFNQAEAFYHPDFIFLPDHGEPLSDRKSILNSFRNFSKANKVMFTDTIDRMDQSGDLAYFFTHYHEVFTERTTGKTVVDTMHSAVFILKKDRDARWKIVLWKWA